MRSRWSNTRIRVAAAASAALVLLVILFFATNGFGLGEKAGTARAAASAGIKPVTGDIVAQLKGNGFTAVRDEPAKRSDGPDVREGEWRHDSYDFVVYTTNAELDVISVKLPKGGPDFWCEFDSTRLEHIVPAFQQAAETIAHDPEETYSQITRFPYKQADLSVGTSQVRVTCYRGYA